MKHMMDVEMAKLIGTDPSLFLENIAFWIKHNYSNDINFHEERYWTFNTQEALVDFFPYWSRDQIKRIIKKCHDAGLLIKGNFNKLSYDRTTWFSLSDEAHAHYGLKLGRNSLRHQAKSSNDMGDIAQPIPDINTDINTDIKDKRKAQPKKQVASLAEPIILPLWLNQECWNQFVQFRMKSSKGTGFSEYAKKLIINELTKIREMGQDPVEVINQSIRNNWKDVYPLKDKGQSNGKDSKYYGQNGKFDSTQWLLDRIKARESGKDPDAIEGNLPVQNVEYLWNTGTDEGGY